MGANFLTQAYPAYASSKALKVYFATNPSRNHALIIKELGELLVNSNVKLLEPANLKFIEAIKVRHEIQAHMF